MLPGSDFSLYIRLLSNAVWQGLDEQLFLREQELRRSRWLGSFGLLQAAQGTWCMVRLVYTLRCTGICNYGDRLTLRLSFSSLAIDQVVCGRKSCIYDNECIAGK